MRSLFMALALLLVACSSSEWTQRSASAKRQALDAGWVEHNIETRDFNLQSWLSPQRTERGLTVYIEGDGYAWVSRSRASQNPTPNSPLALELALAQRTGNAAYLARPCQFRDAAQETSCSIDLWTGARFSEKVIHAIDQALDQLKQLYQSDVLTLVGFSGGGAVAMLVSARRKDVLQVVTVAGNLDHIAWAHLHNVRELEDSLNPPDVWQQVMYLPQVHLVGARDTVMPQQIAQAYRDKFPNRNAIRIEVVDGFDHHCCWAEYWHELREKWILPVGPSQSKNAGSIGN